MNAVYTISLVGQPNLPQDDLQACFRLVEQTSRPDYEQSSVKWRPRKKLEEMASPELRYILVKEKETNTLRGFTSLMPTYEEGEPVVYCYEIHLQPELQGYASATLPSTALPAYLTTTENTAQALAPSSWPSTPQSPSTSLPLQRSC
jgi:hypothetical protein